MGTALTGTEIKDTYDSLIKVTDNGPISGTAKYLSDGLGNDSALALSNAVVGINTSSPNTNYPLSVASASNANAIAVFGRASDNTGSIDFYQNNGSSRILEFGVSTTQVDIYNDLATPIIFSTNSTERLRITSAGNVGIGTSSPNVNLEVGPDSGNRSRLRLTSGAANRMAALEFYGNGAESSVIGYEGGSELIGGGTEGDLVIRNVLSGKDIILYANGGNVGVGTVNPQSTLSVSGTAEVSTSLTLYEATGGSGSKLFLKTVGANYNFLIGRQYNVNNGFEITPSTTAGGSTFSTPAFVIAGGTGNVGIGTSLPTRKLTVNGDMGTQDIVCSTAIYLGGTAAGNALDDYEEGTWTPSFTLGSGSVTYTTQTGTYTKIGRQVVVRMKILVNVASSPSGTLEIAGMPFTASSGIIGSISVFGSSLAATSTQLVGTVTGSSTTMRLYDYASGTLSNPAADLQNGSSIDITTTYFV